MYKKLLEDKTVTFTDVLIWAILVDRYELAQSVSPKSKIENRKAENLKSKIKRMWKTKSETNETKNQKNEKTKETKNLRRETKLYDLATIWRQTYLPVHSALIACHIYATLGEWFAGEEVYQTRRQWFEDKGYPFFFFSFSFLFFQLYLFRFFVVVLFVNLLIAQ